MEEMRVPLLFSGHVHSLYYIPFIAKLISSIDLLAIATTIIIILAWSKPQATALEYKFVHSPLLQVSSPLPIFR
ncbi:uncharacterized protein BDZ99DRAFT_463955 [Mytilinidion resinicola]|uniref:Uncharacterized protein n=1 Tax=Mytilinidion resinicola TaxID=574789 RepID=A0A6A6YK41_9PEZI|nr:uncharacterized protein BDZ99DRAFT_463955 [Mytilinidion resinicola]KAF2809150.1 hypothetical protein BDZ99DRAFT_463955 [Mytilinidion resinicola]